MKKLFLAFALLFGYQAHSHAATTIRMKCLTISVSSSTVTEMAANTSDAMTSTGTTAIKITNLDTANDIWCSHDSAVAISGTTHLGDQVAHASAAPWNWLSWNIGPEEPFYCLSQTAAVKTEVCRYVP
jgi:hypothetical protein